MRGIQITMLDYDIYAVTTEGNDKQQVMNKVLVSSSAEYYIIVPEDQSGMKEPVSKIVLESSEFGNIEELNAEQRLMRFHQKNKIVLESSEFQSIEELDAKIEEYIVKDENNGKWICNYCNKIMSSRAGGKSHAEIHLENIAFRCQFCYATLSTRNSLRDHKSKKHYAEMLERRELENLKMLESHGSILMQNSI